VISPPSSAPPAGVTYTLYDTDGNELYTTTGVYQPGSGSASYQSTSYTLFSGDSVTLNGTSITSWLMAWAAVQTKLKMPTGRTEAANLKEQLAMEEAQSSPAAGRVLTNITMNDSRWAADEGWVKMQQNVNGVIIHYVYNPLIDAVDDYKFVP
jgi:hypothetical protein